MSFENILICGDFNCLSDNLNPDKSVLLFRSLLNKLDLCDLWKYMKGNKQGYTWCNGANAQQVELTRF